MLSQCAVKTMPCVEAAQFLKNNNTLNLGLQFFTQNVELLQMFSQRNAQVTSTMPCVEAAPFLEKQQHPNTWLCIFTNAFST